MKIKGRVYAMAQTIKESPDASPSKKPLGVIDYDYDRNERVPLSLRKVKVYQVPVVERYEQSFLQDNVGTQVAPPERSAEAVPYHPDMTEKKYRKKPWYMRHQCHIHHRNRSLLVRWLVMMSVVHELKSETLHLSVFFIDCFLGRRMVKTAKLKLVGTAALYIALDREMEERKLDFLTGENFTRKQVLRLKWTMMKDFGFNLRTQIDYGFINAYAVLFGMPDKLKNLALYIAELTLLSGCTFMQYPPLKISAASLALARLIFGLEMWTPQLEKITSFTLQSMRTLIRKLSYTHQMAKDRGKRAVWMKYSGEKYHNVAMIEAIDLSTD